MTTIPFNTRLIDPSWEACINQGFAKLDPSYIRELTHNTTWLPGAECIFNAFSLPLHRVNYILFGESPYPRSASANGYAFWDAAVNELWSADGLSKKVNRATSLRNMIKMLLIAEDALQPSDTSQTSIAKLDKQPFVQTNTAFFTRLLDEGFLLLNASPVLFHKQPQVDAKKWMPFMQEIIKCILKDRPQVKLILLGRIANAIDKILPQDKPIAKLYAEHPYNLSFITNPEILSFFKPLHLLRAQ